MTYINPKLPSMIRDLYRADLRERSIQNMLDLAADLVQELIDLRDKPVVIERRTTQVSNTDLDAVHEAIRQQPPYNVMRETRWQYERRLAEAALAATTNHPDGSTT